MSDDKDQRLLEGLERMFARAPLEYFENGLRASWRVRHLIKNSDSVHLWVAFLREKRRRLRDGTTSG